LKINERSLRRLQKQRHMYDIQRMILANPLFKNLNERDQKVLQKLIYKAELAEMYMRDRNVVRINQSFDEIIESVMDMLDGPYTEEELEEKRRREEDDF
jgi:TRAP-type C4-dicarboxylate transport system substrate-binding protein